MSQDARNRATVRIGGHTWILQDRDGTVLMATTTYYTATADVRLAQAQRTLDTHVTSSATGRCLACGTLGPCPKRENAVITFSRMSRLPRRQPGMTRPELVGARRLDGHGLLAGAA